MNVPKLSSGPFRRREDSSTTERTIYVFGWGVPDQQRACALQQHPYFLYIFFTLTKLAELPGSEVGSTRREAESASDSREGC